MTSVSCSRIASRQGPSPSSCWISFARRTTSSLLASVDSPPSALTVKPAWTQRSISEVAASTASLTFWLLVGGLPQRLRELLEHAHAVNYAAHFPSPGHGCSM